MAQGVIRRGAQATSLLAMRCPNQWRKRRKADLQPFEVGIRFHTVEADIMVRWHEQWQRVKSIFLVTVPSVQTEAKDVAKAIVENWILQFGVPDVLHTDQGKNFGSEIVAEMCELWKNDKSRASRATPNGTVK